jgi:hypothetical protein
MTNNGLTLLWTIGGGVLLYFFGKTVRRWTKNSSYIPISHLSNCCEGCTIWNSMRPSRTRLTLDSHIRESERRGIIVKPLMYMRVKNNFTHLDVSDQSAHQLYRETICPNVLCLTSITSSHLSFSMRARIGCLEIRCNH